MLAGFAIGVSGTKLTLSRLLLISLIPVLMTFPVMLFASLVSPSLSVIYSKIISAGLFFLLALAVPKSEKKEDFSLTDMQKSNKLSLKVAAVVGISVGIDASIASFSLALGGASVYLTPLIIGAAHFVLVGLGAATSGKLKMIAKKIPNISGMCFAFLGVLKLL